MKDAYDRAGKELARQRDGSAKEVVFHHKQFLDARIDQLAKWITGGIRPEALVRFCLLDLQTNDKLRACTRESIYLGLLACAVSGLEPGNLKQHAFLVPFAGKATFIAGWRGLIVQARRSREVVGLTANVVREADAFEIDLGTANSVAHRPASGHRGDVVGSYAIATMRGGVHEIEYLDRDDLNRIKDVATKRGASPAWKEWGDQQERKSAIRRLCKRLPMGDDYHKAMALEQAHDEGRRQLDVLDLNTDGAASRAVDANVPGKTADEPDDLSDDEKRDIERAEAAGGSS